MPLCLIVDDSRVTRKIIRQIIENSGFTCEEAENGQIAYDFCANKMPDLIMLDWNMPVMSGIEFLQLLRNRPNGAEPTVIFCTTQNDIAHIQAALEAGANDYIMKPFDKEILTTKLEQNGVLSA